MWQNFSFPTLSKQSVHCKIGNLITDYDKYLRKPKRSVKTSFSQLLDTTDLKDMWLTSKDKKFYMQIETQGRAGYCSNKVADPKQIHPSKRIRNSQIE